jgi:predicted nucleic acid-binding protein
MTRLRSSSARNGAQATDRRPELNARANRSARRLSAAAPEPRSTTATRVARPVTCSLHRLHELSFWHLLVLRCAMVAGCERLLTDDLQHGRVIGGVRIENPFT